MKVELNELFGDYCITKEQGRKLGLILESTMKMKEAVVLDFFRIRLLSGDFMEGAFSKILSMYKKNSVMSRLSFISIKPEMEVSLKFNIEFFTRYHHDNEYKKIIDIYFNPQKPVSTIKNLEVLPFEQEEGEEAEESIYSIERMDVQPDERPSPCGGSCTN